MTAEIKAAIAVLLLIILLGLASGGAYLGYQYRSNSARTEAAEKAANQSSIVTANVLKAVSVINSIAQANTDAKQQTEQQSAERVVVIEKAIAADECAKRRVPAAAVKQLRDHANRIRAGATRANTGKPAG